MRDDFISIEIYEAMNVICEESREAGAFKARMEDRRVIIMEKVVPGGIQRVRLTDKEIDKSVKANNIHDNDIIKHILQMADERMVFEKLGVENATYYITNF